MAISWQAVGESIKTGATLTGMAAAAGAGAKTIAYSAEKAAPYVLPKNWLPETNTAKIIDSFQRHGDKIVDNISKTTGGLQDSVKNMVHSASNSTTLSTAGTAALALVAATGTAVIARKLFNALKPPAEKAAVKSVDKLGSAFQQAGHNISATGAHLQGATRPTPIYTI
jgi:hypothetical protein